jgi:ribonuclease HI
VDPDGKIIFKGSEKIDFSRSYTVTKKHFGTYKKEQTALLRLLRKIEELKIDNVDLFGDNEQLIVRVKKYYNKFVKQKSMSARDLRNLKGMMSRIIGHLTSLSGWSLQRIRSNQNILADYLAKQAIDVKRYEPVNEMVEFRHWEVKHITWT